VTIATRLVIEVPGFDPRDPAEHRRDFDIEYRKACALHSLTGSVGEVKPHPKRPVAKWDVITQGKDWRVATDYRVLRWDDIVREDMARAPWWKIVQMYRTAGVSIINGAFRRLARTDWKFAAFAVSPLLLITAWILLACFFGILAMTFLTLMRAPDIVARLVGVVTGLGAFASMLWLSEPFTGLLLRCDQAATTDQIANRKRKDIEQRLDELASALADAVSKSNADEVVVVGHGFGAVLAIDLVGRALARNAFGDRRIGLLTLGSNAPVVSFDPEAKWFRSRVRQLAVAGSVDWTDVQSPDDALNVCPVDPAADLSLEPRERRNPTVISLRFTDLWQPGTAALRRWRFAWSHGQFVRANERPDAAYDYFLLCCGPLAALARLCGHDSRQLLGAQELV
jgi:hypothetical protein